MIRKTSTGRMEFYGALSVNPVAQLANGKKVTSIDGEILKIQVYGSKSNSPDLKLKVISADGERIIDDTIGASGIVVYYPKNRDAINERLEINSAQRITLGPADDASGLERYFNVGPLTILFEDPSSSGKGTKNIIENVVITYRD